MTTRITRIFGLGLALATMLTLGASLRAPDGLAPIGDDEAAGVRGGAATNTCDRNQVIASQLLCGGRDCPYVSGYQYTTQSNSYANTAGQVCNAGNLGCGNTLVSGCN
jgi:hypothetical protein